MGLFDFVGQVAKATVRTVLTPVEMLKDAATIGGELSSRNTHKRGTYTGEHLKKLADDITDIPDSLDR